MSRKFVIELEDEELIEAEKRYGMKNIGYEIGKAFRANLKRVRNIEIAKQESKVANSEYRKALAIKAANK